MPPARGATALVQRLGGVSTTCNPCPISRHNTRKVPSESKRNQSQQILFTCIANAQNSVSKPRHYLGPLRAQPCPAETLAWSSSFWYLTHLPMKPWAMPLWLMTSKYAKSIQIMLAVCCCSKYRVVASPRTTGSDQPFSRSPDSCLTQALVDNFFAHPGLNYGPAVRTGPAQRKISLKPSLLKCSTWANCVYKRITWTDACAIACTPANSKYTASSWARTAQHAHILLDMMLRLLSFSDVSCQKFILSVFWPGVHGARQECFNGRNCPGIDRNSTLASWISAHSLLKVWEPIQCLECDLGILISILLL